MENNFQMNSASVSDRGLSEKRPQNEDSYLELSSKGVFAVADGVGGAQAGDVASQMAVEIVSEAFTNLPENADAEEVMRIAIQRANEAIYQMASDLPQLSRMATTLVALHLSGNIATIGHVGDSRLYRLDPEGFLYQETEDHSVVAEEVRAGRMTPEQAANHPSRNIISRALGAEPSVEVDMKTIMFEPNTFFLLCSDGITRHIDDSEIRAALFSGAEPAEICHRLKELCYARGAEDNLTAVVVNVSPEIARVEPLAEPIQHTEVEEVTVASARAAAAFSVDEIQPVYVEEPTLEPVAPIVREPKPEFLPPAEQVEEVLEPSTPEISSPVTEEVPAVEPEPAIETFPPPEIRVAETDRSIFSSNSSYYPRGSAREMSSSLIGSNLLSAVGLVLFGAILGFGTYYLWQSANPPEPEQVQVPVLPDKSTNVPLTAFEESRRIVDRDPAGYIMARAASPENAEDYYLLGRAQLLTGKFWEARKSFDEARKRLAVVEPSNAKTLANEIVIAIAILDSPQASDSLTKSLSSANTASGADSNAANQARPIR